MFNYYVNRCLKNIVGKGKMGGKVLTEVKPKSKKSGEEIINKT